MLLCCARALRVRWQGGIGRIFVARSLLEVPTTTQLPGLFVLAFVAGAGRLPHHCCGSIAAQTANLTDMINTITMSGQCGEPLCLCPSF